MSSRQVSLDGGSPWGFRMHGGADAQLPLRIARVNPGSKAAIRGIREGDLISSINGRPTNGLSNAEAHALLRSAQDTLTLGLNQGTTGSPKRRPQKIAQEIKEENSKRTSVTSSSSSISNVSTIIHTISNTEQNNETAHTNGGDHYRADHKTEDPKPETLSNYTSYIRNGSPFTTPHVPVPVPVDNLVQEMDAERWVGMPTEENPNLLVCLSPAQKEFIDKTKAIPNEADSLLDLHRKFIERRGYHEEHDLLTPKTSKDVPTYKIDSSSTKNNLFKIIRNDMSYNDYVKQFTREIPIQILKSNDPEKQNTSGNIRYDTYIKQLVREVPIEVEKQINKPVNNKIYRNAPTEQSRMHPRVHGDRLRARHLGEWLNLARNECDKINNFNEQTNKQSPLNNLVSQRSCEERFSHVSDISNISNISNASLGRGTSPRRYSLPFNLYEQQMQYILQKEQEIQQEIEKLKEEKSKLENDNSASKIKEFDAAKYQISRKGDIAILHSETDKPSTSEKFREEMYNEYMCKVAERQERKQNKVIKIKITTEEHTSEISPKHVCGIEDEFMSKVRERKGKLGLEEEEDAEQEQPTAVNTPPVKLLDGEALADAARLPKHLQEFIEIANSTSNDGVWTPGKGIEPEPAPRTVREPAVTPTTPLAEQDGDEPAPVVWTPRSAGSSPTAERKEFRPVNFESPTLKRKNYSQQEQSSGVATPEGSASVPPPWNKGTGAEERRLTSSQSAPAAGLTSLGKLPRAQNPTITLLQKAREGQLPRGASYIEETQAPSPKPRSKDSRPPLIGPNEILYTIKTEYISESDSEKPKKMADLGPRKFEGIGPTTKDGMPIVLRSIYDEQEVKDANQAKWYKRMYDTLHRSRNDDEYVGVRYKTRRGRYPYTSAGGYLSEPEPNAYDSDVGVSANKYATLDRRRLQTGRDKENEYITYTVPRNKYMSASVRHSTDVYKNQPGRIENYVPGHSSISEKEAKEWWDEVMEIFDGWLDDHSALPSLNYMLSQVTARSHLEQQKHVPPSKSYMSHALKESGYESDSTLVFRRREDAASQLSPHEQKAAYKTIQKGGEVPLHGLRKAAPERPKESPRKYVDDEVTIHYRSPVRHEVKEALSEEELARRQAEAMRRIYQEERRRKYLQELQDMNSRRHTDNFIPSQKSPIPLNRYDDFGDDLGSKPRARSRSPEQRIVARALYNFVGQSARELTFRKGDVIYIRRQVDKNWFEGEHNAMLGLFPSNYVEIIPYDGIKSTPRKANEGQARAKFNFIAQTHLELSLAKGELIVLTRRVDDNWFEGRIGSRKGIFPVSYVEILIDPGDKPDISISSTKPVASPAAHSLLLNGSAGGKESMGSHHYQPSYTSPQTTTSYHAKPVNVIGTSASYSSLTRTQRITAPSVNEALHIDTQSEPVPYRALYKYRPQNDDELELQEGDTVFVLEKCDDGWFVGSSQRTGSFGTFPGNYVERI